MIVVRRPRVAIVDDCQVVLNVVARRINVYPTSYRAGVTSFKSVMPS